VTANFFEVIGLPAQIGRMFREDEDKPGAPALAVISDRLWTAPFTGIRDRWARGQFSRSTVHVTGVMPREMDSPHGVDAWFSVMRRSANPGWQNRANHPMFFAWGRLKESVTAGTGAERDVRPSPARLEKIYPATNAGTGVAVRPLLENLLGNYRTSLALLLGAVALVLLIACANLANLLAARGAARAREFAIRAAMGAGRGQIIRQLLIESLPSPPLVEPWVWFFATWGRRRARRLRSGRRAAF